MLPSSERFSSSDLAGLKYVDGFGELPGLPGAAEEFAQDAPGFELGVGAFAGAGQLGVNAVGGLLRGELSLSLYGYGCARWPRRSPCPPAPAGHWRPVRARSPRSGRRSGRAWRRGADQIPAESQQRWRSGRTEPIRAKGSRPADAVKPGELFILPALWAPHRHHDSMCGGRPAESEARQRNGQPRRRRRAAAGKGRTDEA